MLTNSKQQYSHSAIEPDRDDVVVLISNDGWVLYWGRHEDLEALSEGIGRKEFADASIYCG